MMESGLHTRWTWTHTLTMSISGSVALAGALLLQGILFLLGKPTFMHGGGFGYGLVMFIGCPPIGLFLDLCSWLGRITLVRLRGRPAVQSPERSAIPLLTHRR